MNEPRPLIGKGTMYARVIVSMVPTYLVGTTVQVHLRRRTETFPAVVDFAVGDPAPPYNGHYLGLIFEAEDARDRLGFRDTEGGFSPTVSARLDGDRLEVDRVV
jgi:hypothetical protein